MPLINWQTSDDRKNRPEIHNVSPPRLNKWATSPMSFSTTNTTATVGAQVASNTLGTPWTQDNNYVLFECLVPNGSNEKS